MRGKFTVKVKRQRRHSALGTIFALLLAILTFAVSLTWGLAWLAIIFIIDKARD